MRMINEHSIYICYRRDDGEDLATWIHKNLQGRSLSIDAPDGSKKVVILTTQLDSASASGANWEEDFIKRELSLADSLCVVCSPAALVNKPTGTDYVDFEISWWVENRRNYPPILVEPKKYARNYIPPKISDAWPNPQVSTFDPTDNDKFLESIERGIASSAESAVRGSELGIKPEIYSKLQGFYYWEKDKFGRYIQASELYAQAAGFDSPKSMIGKTDYDMPWRSLAPMFQEGDRRIMTVNELERIHVFEKEIMVDRVADILVYEGVLRDHSNRIIGVSGYFVDVTGDNLPIDSIKYKMDESGIDLGEDFGNQRLELDEIKVFQAMVRNTPKEKIALQLNFSLDKVDDVMKSLRRKLQCTRDEEILVIAIRSGLPLKLFGV